MSHWTRNGANQGPRNSTTGVRVGWRNRSTLNLAWVVACALCLSGCSSSIQGRNEALADIRSNKLVFKTAGMPFPSDRIYAELLRKRYDIQFESVASCVISPSLAQYTEAYNKIMLPEIQRRYGFDVLERTQEDAAHLLIR